MKTMMWHVSVLALLTALAACSKKSEEPGAEGTDRTEAQAELAAAGADASGDRVDPKDLGALVDLIVAEAAALPREEFDPAALAAKLGKNPQAHFEWVRDHTWWAPYRGLLRGPKGVMLDRVGSNLDRAMLLGDLLRRSGHTIRLARAELTGGQARELLGKVRPIPGKRVEIELLAPMSAARVRAIEKVVPGFEATVQEQLATSHRIADEAWGLIRAQTDELHQLAKDRANSAAGADEDAAVAAMRDHWWIEREESGNWIAMDVLLPGAQAGSTLVAASGRSEWSATEEMPVIPEADWHTIGIRVVVERYEGGNTTESTALETTIRPAAVFDQRITLSHFPRPWPENMPDFRTDPDALGNAVVNVKEWTPILRVGDDYVTQSAFTEGGDLIAEPFNSQRDIAATGGGGFMSGFGEALGGGESAASSITAEWIDYYVSVPGRARQHVRRPVFDLLGPANREKRPEGFDANTNDLLVYRYEALLSMTEILVQPCEFTSAFVAHLDAAGVVANQEEIRQLFKEPDPAKRKLAAVATLQEINMWGSTLNFAVWRSYLGAKSDGWFIDQPNVISYRMTQPVVNADRAATRELIDISFNSTGVHRSERRSPFDVRLERGVVDTVSEVLALGADMGMSENTASVFAMTAGNPDRIRLFGPRDAASVRNLDLPEDVAARLEQDVDAGFLVIGLASPVQLNEQSRMGWWRIDALSGETIGVMDTGFHAALGEKQVTEMTMQRLLHSMVQREIERDIRALQRQYGIHAATFLAAKLAATLAFIAFSD